MKYEKDFISSLNLIQAKVCDATEDYTDMDKVSEKFYQMQQSWKKNKFKPISKMEYLMRKIKLKWGNLLYRWDRIMNSGEILFVLFVIISFIAIALGIIIGIYFPEF